MKSFALMLSLSVLLPGGQRLATDYSGKEVRRIEVETRIELESSTTVSGGEDSGRGAMPSSSSQLELREVAIDRVIEHTDGRPDKVERTFEDVGGKVALTSGEREREAELESPLSGVTLEIVRGDDDAIEVSVKKGTAPDKDEALAGHRPELFLDALLPAGEVDVDATWDLDDEAVQRALRLDVQAGMYAPPAPEEGGADGRPRRGSMLAGELRLLRGIEWKGKAKFAAREDVEQFVRIELEIEGAGEVADPERTGAGGRMFDPVPAPAFASTVKVKLEGTLVLSLTEKRPWTLELEGPVSIEASREREREGRTIKIETKSEGTLTYKVSIAADG